MKTNLFAFKVGTLDVPDIPGTKFPVSGANPANLGTIVNEFLKYLFPAAGLLLFFFLVIGGLSFLTSGGDPKAMEKAKGKITNALVGFLIIFVAYWLVQLLEYIFGITVFK